MKNATSEMTVICFRADLDNKKLYVPKQIIEKAHILNSMESRLYFERLHRYPGFEVVVR